MLDRLTFLLHRAQQLPQWMALGCLLLAAIAFWKRERQAIARLEAQVAERTAELEREKAFWKRLVHHAPIAIGYMDRELIIRWLNPSYERVWHRKADMYLGKKMFDVAPAARATLGPVIADVVRTGEFRTLQGYTFQREIDGVTETAYCDASYVPVPGANGEIEGVMVLLVDTTAREAHARLQQETIARLESLDRYKDEFLSVISHELRTPLNFIMGFASMMEDGLAGPVSPDHQQYLGRIVAGAERMRGLVDDLLDYAKLRAGKLALEPIRTVYAPLVEDVVATLRPLADASRLLIDLDVQVPRPVLIDDRRITQVITNLLSNAIKFSSDGVITVRAFVAGDRLVTEVIDCGVGIAPDDLPRLFNRFEQLDMSPTRPAGGTGLGLAIVKDLVAAHGGTVGVKSELGVGSTFWFELPVGQESFVVRP